MVQWTTRDAGRPEVRYGSAPGQYTATVPATTHTYTAADLCGSPANSTGYVPPGSLHVATLDGLMPSMRYYYTFGDPVSQYMISYHY